MTGSLVNIKNILTLYFFSKYIKTEGSLKTNPLLIHSYNKCVSLLNERLKRLVCDRPKGHRQLLGEPENFSFVCVYVHVCVCMHTKEYEEATSA